MIAILPTPSGAFHAGTLSTYLAAWCIARQEGKPLLVLPDARRGAFPDVAMHKWYQDAWKLLNDWEIPPDKFVPPIETYKMRDHYVPKEVLDRCYPCLCEHPLPLPEWYADDPCRFNEVIPRTGCVLRQKGTGMWCGTMPAVGEGEPLAARVVEHVRFIRKAGISTIVRARDLTYHALTEEIFSGGMGWTYPQTVFTPVLTDFRDQKLSKSAGAKPIQEWPGKPMELLGALWLAMQPGASLPESHWEMASMHQGTSRFNVGKINKENYRFFDVLDRYFPKYKRFAGIL